MVPIYAALGVPLDPDTIGSLEDVVPGVTWEDAAAAVRAELGEHWPRGPGSLAGVRPEGETREPVPAALLARARALRERHVPAPR
jgi:hypothetical protein